MSRVKAVGLVALPLVAAGRAGASERGGSFPYGDPDGLRAALVSGSPTPKEYASDPGEAVRGEDVGIGAFPLEIEEERVTRIPVEEIFGD